MTVHFAAGLEGKDQVRVACGLGLASRAAEDPYAWTTAKQPVDCTNCRRSRAWKNGRGSLPLDQDASDLHLEVPVFSDRASRFKRRPPRVKRKRRSTPHS